MTSSDSERASGSDNSTENGEPYRNENGLSHPSQEDVEKGVGHHVCPDCCKRACLCGGRACPHCGYDGGYQMPADQWSST